MKYKLMDMLGLDHDDDEMLKSLLWLPVAAAGLWMFMILIGSIPA